MAKAVINLQKESGGIVKISPVDGTGVTEVTVPENGELVTKVYVDGLLNTSTVKLTGNQSISGVKTFSSTISGSISGNAATATKLATARTINGVSFDGTANIVAPTNLGITAGTTAGPIVTSSTGTNATLPTASASASGVVTTEAQIWAGVKTFSLSPIVPTPSTNTQAANKGYVDSVVGGTTFVANDNRVKTSLNATGGAPIYACRAWVNFNGTGTVAIRASGNVSSITDLNQGTYRINFSTNMPDASYSCALEIINGPTAVPIVTIDENLVDSSCTIATSDYGGARLDFPYVTCSIFR